MSQVTDAVHAKGSFMYLQLWALGRAASVEKLKEEDPSFEYVSAGDVPVPRTPEQEENGEDAARPRPLTKAEISEYVQLYATAAREAVERAGFDGVEIHGANGYLLDQFLKETSNNRTDEYGGSPENNARFVLDVAAAVSAAVGEERVGLRLSPWVSLLGMRIVVLQNSPADPPPRQITSGTIRSLCSPILSRNYADATRTSGTYMSLNHASKAYLTAPLMGSRTTSCVLFGLANGGSQQAGSRGKTQSSKLTSWEN
jgi:2,4-dienoyl-CoA reductase-like NADH-dependent reductase (Old Yellow Enzyme family)